MAKSYDRAYFEKWYRHPGFRVRRQAALRKKAAMAVAVAEHVNGRPVRSILDVGCGEGAWRFPLKELRPQARYLGIDPSEYVVTRFGAARNIRHGSFGQLAGLRLAEAYDLVVCSDVLHYVEEPELVRGLEGLSRILRGVAYLDVLTLEDQPEGDLEGFHARPASWYRRRFRVAGLTALGLGFYVGESAADDPTALELG